MIKLSLKTELNPLKINLCAQVSVPGPWISCKPRYRDSFLSHLFRVNTIRFLDQTLSTQNDPKNDP